MKHVKPESRGYWLLPETAGETKGETETQKSETGVSNETVDETPPWVRLGVSKATYYRRKQAQKPLGGVAYG